MIIDFDFEWKGKGNSILTLSSVLEGCRTLAPQFPLVVIILHMKQLDKGILEAHEKCKYGLFKGRSSKYPAGSLSFPASFYKGLEELENELDPKQIEKLIVFFEVMSTQEKISKVRMICIGLLLCLLYSVNKMSEGNRVNLNKEKIKEMLGRCFCGYGNISTL